LRADGGEFHHGPIDQIGEPFEESLPCQDLRHAVVFAPGKDRVERSSLIRVSRIGCKWRLGLALVHLEPLRSFIEQGACVWGRILSARMRSHQESWRTAVFAARATQYGPQPAVANLASLRPSSAGA
jgi:hypothetical protein